MSTNPDTAADSPVELDPVELVLTFVRLSDKARRQGLLSLEEEMAGLPSQDLRDAVAEVIDGTPPQTITQVLDLRIDERRRRRKDELRRELALLQLVKTGVLAVQRGDPPRLVRTLLDAQLAPADKARVRETIKTYTPPPRPHPPTPAPGWTEADVQNLALDSVLKLSQRDMQSITRHLDRKDLNVGLRNASDDVRERFFRAMSNRAATQVREDMELMGPQRLSVIEEAQQRIIQVMRRLVEANEIGRGER